MSLIRNRTLPLPRPTRSGTELTDPLMSHHPETYDTRHHTRLVVERFSNLALLATLFCGIQAQLISSTSTENSTTISVATNAVLFGGLTLSICSAVLADLSGRWFSSLREDEAEFFSSYWLAAESRQKPLAFRDYLKFQRGSLMNKLPGAFSREYNQPWEPTVIGNTPVTMDDLADMEAGTAKPNPRERDLQFMINMIDEEINSGITFGEKMLSKVLLSTILVWYSAFVLLCMGIMLLVWGTQPLPVALFATVLLGWNLLFVPSFFLKHRRKRVLSQLISSTSVLLY